MRVSFRGAHELLSAGSAVDASLRVDCGSEAHAMPNTPSKPPSRQARVEAMQRLFTA
jgi:hypothetical protein